MIDGWSTSCEIALRWIPLDLTDAESILVQVMAWCLMLGAVRQQAITWANVDPDLCCHMASLGHNELDLFEFLQILNTDKAWIAEVLTIWC